MKIFIELYPYIILCYGLFVAALLTCVGCLLGFDLLRNDQRYDAGRFIPALAWFCFCALLSGAVLGLTKWALIL